jgi:hypothetical protein
MNNKPNIPEDTGLVTLNLRKISIRTDLKVNGWLFVSMLTAAVSDLLLHGNIFRGWHIQEKNWPVLSELMHHHGEDWPVLMRVIVELLPMFMSLLWIRDVARWIRGMDELHRRIMLETCLFAVIGTFFFITAWNRLQNTGVLKAIFQPASPPLHRWDYRQLAYLDFSNFAFIAALLVSFFVLGHFFLNRRYK